VDRLAIIDQGKVVGMGTPASLKEQDRQKMRLEVTLELGAEVPPLPAFAAEPFSSGRRLMVRLDEAFIAPATEWAQDLKKKEIVEEFSLGPTTLEDAYVRMVGRLDALETAGVAGK
jgi:ABC-2 type transport system ATP-binding protein